jgi:hypothetical protein
MFDDAFVRAQLIGWSPFYDVTGNLRLSYLNIKFRNEDAMCSEGEFLASDQPVPLSYNKHQNW